MKNNKHKEEMPSFSISYLNDVKRISSKIITNRFSASQFQKLNSPITRPDTIAEDAKKVIDIGNQQYQGFVKTRFVLGSEDVINSPIIRMRWIDGVHEEADNRIVIHIADMIRKQD